MAPATAPVLVAAVLLALAGVGKVRRPAGTVGALRSVGIATPRIAVRALGLAEVALGTAALAVGGALTSALIGVGYLGFTGFLVLALRRGGAVSSCGCFGRPDTPPTRTHAVVTTALAAGALVAAALGGAGPVRPTVTATDATLLGFSALATWLAWLAFAVLPHARLPRLEER